MLHQVIFTHHQFTPPPTFPTAQLPFTTLHFVTIVTHMSIIYKYTHIDSSSYADENSIKMFLEDIVTEETQTTTEIWLSIKKKCRN